MTGVSILCAFYLIMFWSVSHAQLEESSAVCQDDYSPCSCHSSLTEFEPFVYQVTCQKVSLATIQSAFRAKTSASRQVIGKISVTLLPSDSTIPPDVFGGKPVQYIEVACTSPSLPLRINREAFPNASSTQVFNVKGCDLSQMDYAFLKDFTSLHTLNIRDCSNVGDFHTLPVGLARLTSLVIADSTDFRELEQFPAGLDRLSSLSIQNCTNFASLRGLPSLSNLRTLEITSCPNFRNWEVIGTQLTGLSEIHLRNSALNDQAAGEMLNAISSSPVSETLTLLDLTENVLTRIPEQISRFSNLAYLYLNYNNVSFLAKGSSVDFKNKLRTLSLVGNGLKTIEPGAFQRGRLSTTQIDLRHNNLTRLESSVFRNLLEKMAAENETGGQLLMYHNWVECDCHLAWLVRDRRDLLGHFFSFPSCSNGTEFFSLDPQGFANCGESTAIEDASPPSITQQNEHNRATEHKITKAIVESIDPFNINSVSSASRHFFELTIFSFTLYFSLTI